MKIIYMDDKKCYEVSRYYCSMDNKKPALILETTKGLKCELQVDNGKVGEKLVEYIESLHRLYPLNEKTVILTDDDLRILMASYREEI